MSKTIAVAGATGFVGRHVVRELLLRGYRVRALIRDAQKAREVFPNSTGIEFVTGHVLDGKSPAKLVHEADACINLIGIIREVRGDAGAGGAQTFQGMHVEAPRALTAACQDAGVKRFIQMSALGATPEGRAVYQRTKYEGEQVVRRTHLEWTIFRPTFIHGAEGDFVQMVSDMCSGQAAPWYFIPYFGRPKVDTRVPLGGVHLEPARIQPVAVQDVATAFAESLNRPKTIGEIYNLVGPDVFTWPEVLQFFRDTLPGASHDMPVSAVPGEPSVIAARVAKALGLGGLLPFDDGQAIMAMQDSTAELRKVHEHLGLTPKPFKPTVLEYAGSV